MAQKQKKRDTAGLQGGEECEGVGGKEEEKKEIKTRMTNKTIGKYK